MKVLADVLSVVFLVALAGLLLAGGVMLFKML